MLLKYLAKKLANELINHKKLKEKRKKKRLERKKNKKSMINLFGRTRYYLSILFGQWILVTWNNRDYRDVEYEKFYKDEKIAKRYANKLKEKYDNVQIERIYNKRRIEVGYLVSARGKKVVAQPSNIVPLKYRTKV